MNQSLPIILITGILLGYSCREQKKEVYEPTPESLDKHKTPQWFTDAKFGIFIHWGVYAVPAYHEWYLVFYSPNARYGKNLGGPPYTAAQGDLSDSLFNVNIRKDANEYHRTNFGVDFDYDEFIPMFKTENYDPESWAELLKKPVQSMWFLLPNMVKNLPCGPLNSPHAMPGIWVPEETLQESSLKRSVLKI